jgi:hypothetical protein
MTKKDLPKLFTSTLLTYADLKLCKRSEQVHKIQAKANNSMEGVRQEVASKKLCGISVQNEGKRAIQSSLLWGSREKRLEIIVYNSRIRIRR